MAEMDEDMESFFGKERKRRVSVSTLPKAKAYDGYAFTKK